MSAKCQNRTRQAASLSRSEAVAVGPLRTALTDTPKEKTGMLRGLPVSKFVLAVLAWPPLKPPCSAAGRRQVETATALRKYSRGCANRDWAQLEHQKLKNSAPQRTERTLLRIYLANP